MSNYYDKMFILAKLRGLFFIFFLLLFFSCSNNKTEKVISKTNDTLKLNYAEGFSVQYYTNYKAVIVYSPWIKGTVYTRYYLVPDMTVKTPTDGIKVKIPLQTLAATSVTHLEFLTMLHELKTLRGVCSPKLIYNREVQKLFGEKKIDDLGDAFNINVEKTLQLKPNAVMMSGYNQNDPYAQRVSQAGIPVLFNNEWMETSLLARAEWIKFVATFYNKEKSADSLFATIEKCYNDIRYKAKSLTHKPSVMAGSNFRGTWYMPGGRSFMGQLFADAGAQYYFTNDTTSGSLPLNLEMVLKNFSQSDVWLNCSSNSIAELLNADSKHGLFKPVKTQRVYNFNKRLLPSTANDFWESAVARPDLLLADLIAILHPELLPGYELVYAQKLNM